ncbi:MAG TPA: hypothetical protein VEL11_06730, partial [Candidatus Bathyarchaeia archaeon]|nr:hypothetical protein [Candidatus Bathyarchaeia archaeon]
IIAIVFVCVTFYLQSQILNSQGKAKWIELCFLTFSNLHTLQNLAVCIMNSRLRELSVKLYISPY